MGFFSLLTALFIEQLRPLAYQDVIRAPFSRMLEALRSLCGSHDEYGVLVIWLVLVPGMVLLTGAVWLALHAGSPLLAWLWTVFVLYLTLGFRRFSHYFSDIHLALRMDEVDEAARILDTWNDAPTHCTDVSSIARKSIEKVLVASHRHVFGVILWFIILPGPCGAVLYRAAACFAESTDAVDEDDAFAFFARKAFAIVDWLPQRLTAVSYAIVGNFENAMYCWRNLKNNQTTILQDDIVLASGAGALGISLGSDENTDEETDKSVNVTHLQSTVGLLWRALIFWLFIVLLLSFARLTTL